LIFIGGNYNEDFIHHKSRAYGLNLIKYINGFLDNKVIIDEVSKLNADVIFIGTGVPKQELLAIEISKNVNDLVIICVGNFFNFYFNFQKRAPSFFRKLGLEWLYRLSLEPKRLWKRYTIENLFFIKEYLIAKKK
jgi:N-acetylglucosaminyldiphosphoundecaprenol N-acetyl-beta-D-mannosaminyltransferase